MDVLADDHLRHIPSPLSMAAHMPCSFFFSSRRRHTRSDRDWSSDVCSSDLGPRLRPRGSVTGTPRGPHRIMPLLFVVPFLVIIAAWVLAKSAFGVSGAALPSTRSEERRVGKECRSRWSPYH